MHVIIGKRRSGRTTELIKLCAAAEARHEASYIVCHDPGRVAAEANRLELFIAFPLTYDEFLEKRYYGTYIKNFFIDNVDLLLQYIAGSVNVAAIAVDASIVNYLEFKETIDVGML